MSYSFSANSNSSSFHRDEKVSLPPISQNYSQPRTAWADPSAASASSARPSSVSGSQPRKRLTAFLSLSQSVRAELHQSSLSTPSATRRIPPSQAAIQAYKTQQKAFQSRKKQQIASGPSARPVTAGAMPTAPNSSSSLASKLSLIDRERRMLFAFLSSPDCGLFSSIRDPIPLSEDDLDLLLLSSGNSSALTTAHLRRFDLEEQKFSGFPDLIPAVYQAHMKYLEHKNKFLLRAFEAAKVGKSTLINNRPESAGREQRVTFADSAVPLSGFDVDRIFIACWNVSGLFSILSCLLDEQRTFASVDKLIEAVRSAPAPSQPPRIESLSSSVSRVHPAPAKSSLVYPEPLSHDSKSAQQIERERIELLTFLAEESAIFANQSNSEITASASGIDSVIRECDHSVGKAIEFIRELDRRQIRLNEFSELLDKIRWIKAEIRKNGGDSKRGDSAVYHALFDLPGLSQEELSAQEGDIRHFLLSPDCVLLPASQSHSVDSAEIHSLQQRCSIYSLSILQHINNLSIGCSSQSPRFPTFSSLSSFTQNLFTEFLAVRNSAIRLLSEPNCPLFGWLADPDRKDEKERDDLLSIRQIDEIFLGSGSCLFCHEILQQFVDSNFHFDSPANLQYALAIHYQQRIKNLHAQQQRLSQANSSSGAGASASAANMAAAGISAADRQRVLEYLSSEDCELLSAPSQNSSVSFAIRQNSLDELLILSGSAALALYYLARMNESGKAFQEFEALLIDAKEFIAHERAEGLKLLQFLQANRAKLFHAGQSSQLQLNSAAIESLALESGATNSSLLAFSSQFLSDGMKFHGLKDLLQAIRLAQKSSGPASSGGGSSLLSAAPSLMEFSISEFFNSPFCHLFSTPLPLLFVQSELENLLFQLSSNLPLFLVYLKYSNFINKKFPSFQMLKLFVLSLYNQLEQQKIDLLNYLQTKFLQSANSTAGSDGFALLTPALRNAIRQLSVQDMEALYIQGEAGPFTINILKLLEDANASGQSGALQLPSGSIQSLTQLIQAIKFLYSQQYNYRVFSRTYLSLLLQSTVGIGQFLFKPNLNALQFVHSAISSHLASSAAHADLPNGQSPSVVFLNSSNSVLVHNSSVCGCPAVTPISDKDLMELLSAHRDSLLSAFRVSLLALKRSSRVFTSSLDLIDFTKKVAKDESIIAEEILLKFGNSSQPTPLIRPDLMSSAAVDRLLAMVRSEAFDPLHLYPALLHSLHSDAKFDSFDQLLDATLSVLTQIRGNEVQFIEKLLVLLLLDCTRPLFPGVFPISAVDSSVSSVGNSFTEFFLFLLSFVSQNHSASPPSPSSASFTFSSLGEFSVYLSHYHQELLQGKRVLLDSCNKLIEKSRSSSSRGKSRGYNDPFSQLGASSSSRSSLHPLDVLSLYRATYDVSKSIQILSLIEKSSVIPIRHFGDIFIQFLALFIREIVKEATLKTIQEKERERNNRENEKAKTAKLNSESEQQRETVKAQPIPLLSELIDSNAQQKSPAQSPRATASEQQPAETQSLESAQAAALAQLESQTREQTAAEVERRSAEPDQAVLSQKSSPQPSQPQSPRAAPAVANPESSQSQNNQIASAGANEAEQLSEEPAKTETQAQAQTDAAVKAEAEAKAKADADADARARADAEAQAQAQAQARAQAEAEAEAKAKADADAKAKADAEAAAKAKAAAEAEEAEKRRRAEAEEERKREEEAERKAAEERARAEAEEKARAEAEAAAKAQAEAEARAKEAEAVAKAKAEAEAKAKAEAEAKARAEAEAKAKAEAEAKAKAEAEEAERKRKEAEAERQRKAQEEAERLRKEQEEAERKRAEEAERKKREAEEEEKKRKLAEEEQKRKDAEAAAEAERKRLEAERVQREEAEKARIEREKKREEELAKLAKEAAAAKAAPAPAPAPVPVSSTPSASGSVATGSTGSSRPETPGQPLLGPIPTDKIIEYFTSGECQLFNSSSDLEIDVEELEDLVRAAHNNEDTAIGILKQMDALHMQFKTFQDLKPAFKQYTKHRRQSTMSTSLKSALSGMPSARTPMRVDSLGQTNTQAHNTGLSASLNPSLNPSPSAAAASASAAAPSSTPSLPLSTVNHALEADRGRVIEFLQSDDCYLFSDSDELEVREEDIDQALTEFEGVRSLLQHMRTLNDVGRRFASFPQLIAAIQEARESGTHLSEAARDGIVTYLSDESCRLFSDSTEDLEVNGNDLDQLVALCKTWQAAVECLKQLDRQGQRFMQFGEVIELLVQKKLNGEL